MTNVEIPVPFNYRPREYQMPVWRHFNDGDPRRKRGVCIWHRRAGKDLFAINLIMNQLMRRVGTYWHLFPEYKQARNVIWNGITKECPILKKPRPYRDYFPKEFITRDYENDMRIHFVHPDNTNEEGSVYQLCGSDNYNSLVGTNPIGVVISEYALCDPAAWDYLRPILRENKGWALFITTFRGKNHAYKLYKMAESRPERWFSQLLTVDDTRDEEGLPVVSQEDIEEERADGMPEELVRQEFYCDPDAPLVGAYYSQQMAKALLDGRITNVPYDPHLEVMTAWDIGFRDTCAIIFAQRYGLELRIIDYYRNSGESVAHYVRILRERGYTYGRHYAPFDIQAKTFASGKSAQEVAASLGVRFTITAQHEVTDGIEQCRNTLPMCWIDKTKCNDLIESLKSYRKEWDQKLRVFKDYPVHDEHSHPADAFRYLCWNVKMRASRHREEQPQLVAEDNFAYV